MESNKKNKIIIAFFVFLGLMWLCTVISKSIYASKLPIVSTESIEQKYVEHIVEVDGIVVAGDKNPIAALSGLRVEKLMVQAGDRIEAGDVIFTVDMDDLDGMLEEKRTAISKLQAQIDTILQNEELARQQKELEEQRAREDYDALAQRQNTLVGRAAEEYSKIEDEIDKQRNEEIERRRKEAEEKRKAERENHSEDDENDSEDSEGYYEDGDYYYEDGNNYYEGDENFDGGIVDEALLEALQQAAYAEADAEWERDNTMKEAGRRVEDTTLPENEDSALEVNRLELARLQEDLARFQEIKDAEGQIKADQDGLVTDIYISIGGRTSDSAVMLLADDSVPCRFKAVISQEQKKYVGLNDQVALKLDGSSREKDATVDYLEESSSLPGSYDIYIDLPEGTGVPGLSGTMSRSESGEKHPVCVTPQAVHKADVQSYVYVVRERDGILGKEYYAEQIKVRILDENESWVAVEGALDNESIIITSSTKEVGNGDVIRLEE